MVHFVGEAQHLWFSRAPVTIFIPLPPQTSMNVTRPRQPPHCASMPAASIPMAPSAVSAGQDLRPPTSHITVRLRDLGPERRRLGSHYACSLGASRARLPPSSLQVCQGASQSGFRMDRRRGVPATAPVSSSPAHRHLGPGVVQSWVPCRIPCPFIQLSIKTPILYFGPLPALFFFPKAGSPVR